MIHFYVVKWHHVTYHIQVHTVSNTVRDYSWMGRHMSNGHWPWHSRALAWTTGRHLQERRSTSWKVHQTTEYKHVSFLLSPLSPLFIFLPNPWAPTAVLLIPLYSLQSSYRLLTACSWIWNRIEFSCTCYFLDLQCFFVLTPATYPKAWEDKQCPPVKSFIEYSLRP